MLWTNVMYNSVVQIPCGLIHLPTSSIIYLATGVGIYGYGTNHPKLGSLKQFIITKSLQSSMTATDHSETCKIIYYYLSQFRGLIELSGAVFNLGSCR